MELRDINHPYRYVDYKGITYTSCKDFNHISRYKGLRQVVHNPQDIQDRFMCLETMNPFSTNCELVYHQVRTDEENRLDLIAQSQLGSAQYSWIIAYVNNIKDGYTVYPGQVIAIPTNFTSLFGKGEILESVSPFALNLGSE